MLGDEATPEDSYGMPFRPIMGRPLQGFQQRGIFKISKKELEAPRLSEEPSQQTWYNHQHQSGSATFRSW